MTNDNAIADDVDTPAAPVDTGDADDINSIQKIGLPKSEKDERDESNTHPATIEDSVPKFDDLVSQHDDVPKFDDLVNRQDSTMIGLAANQIKSDFGVSTGDELTTNERQILMQQHVGKIFSATGQSFYDYMNDNVKNNELFKEGMNPEDFKNYMHADDIVNKGWYDGFVVPGIKTFASLIESDAAHITAPLKTILPVLYHTPGALFNAYFGDEGSIRTAGQEAGAPAVGEAIAELPEAFPDMEFFEFKHNAEIAGMQKSLQENLFKPISTGVVGPGATEESYFGTEKMSPQQTEAVNKASSELPNETPTIHEVARQIAPEVFEPYDQLNKERDLYSGMLNTLRESQRSELADFEDKAPHNEEIADLQSKLEGASARNAKRYQEQITDLTAKNNEWIEQQKKSETPDMATLREAIQKTDEQMRDIAYTGKIKAAYEEAQKRMPPEPVKQQSMDVKGYVDDYLSGKGRDSLEHQQFAANNSEAIETEFKSRLQDESNTKEAPEGVSIKPASEQHAFIAKDVSDKLVAAGRPKEEADAASQLVAEHYIARAERFGGKAGTAEEMYARDGAEIKAGKTRAKTLSQDNEIELSQKAKGKIRLASDDAKAAITLFKSADASTFIHETGHHWLEELMSDAAHEEAPEDLKADAKAVRDWLGVKDGEDIATRQHEKFARGFERYMMEGTAPSKALARAFAQFKDWLTKIYQTVDRLKSPINDDIRGVFDRFLSSDPERQPVIAPEDVEEPEPQATHQPKQTAAQDQAVPPEQPPFVSPVPQESTETSPEISPKKSIESEGEKERDNFIGNINMDKIVGGDGFEEAVRAAADKNNDFIEQRRGKMSIGQTIDLADFLGRDPAFLDRKKIGEAFNAEEIIAAKKLLLKAYDGVRSAAEESRQAQASGIGREEAAVNLAKAISTHEYFQGKVAQAAAESGRALAAHKAVVSEAAASADLSEFLKQNTGRDLFQLEKMAKFMEKLTPEQGSKFINDTSGGKMAKVQRAILYYYINALLSGPFTHMRYFVGNEIKSLVYRPLIETPIAATYGHINSLFGKTAEDRVYFREIGPQLTGWWMGHKDGYYAGLKAWESGFSEPLPGEQSYSNIGQTPQIGGNGALGKVVHAYGAPTRAIAAIHSMNKAVPYTQSNYALAMRQAISEGLDGQALIDRFTQLKTTPTEEMMEKSSQSSLQQMYMEPADYDSFIGHISRAVNSNIFAKLMIPFLKVGSRITKETFIQGSPLGLLTKEVQENLAAGGATRDMQLARMTAGTGLMATAAILTHKGEMTGDGPTDPKARAEWLLTHKPNTITIGHVSIPYAGLGSLGMALRFGANMTETAELIGHEDAAKISFAFMESMNKSVLDDNFMRGAKDLLDAVYHPEEYGKQYIQNMASNWLPWSVGLGQVARVVDPDMRQAHTLLESYQKKIPYISEGLYPRRDSFGEPIPNGGSNRYRDDPVVHRLDALGIGVSKIEPKIRGVDLTEKQADEYAMLAGRNTKMRLNNLVAQQSFARQDSGVQVLQINKIIQGAREDARKVMMTNYPEIMKKAHDNKVRH